MMFRNLLVIKFLARGYAGLAAQPLLEQQDSKAVFYQDLHFIARFRFGTPDFRKNRAFHPLQKVKGHRMEAIFGDFRGVRGHFLIPNRHSCSAYPGARPPSLATLKVRNGDTTAICAKNHHANPFSSPEFQI
jgi:hypothetical protein